MKKNFPEYYPLTSEEKDKLWKEAVFVFDANVLLNLYRYSEKTREEFLNILEKISERIWLPHQFAFEYQRGRLGVIDEQVRAYENISNKLEKTIKSINGDVEIYRNRHPFLKIDKFIKKIESSIKGTIKEIKSIKTKHPNWSEKDPIRLRLDQLFEGKIGEPCKNFDDVIRQGQDRYSKDIPPGYKDKNKDALDPSGIRKYGDWIGWYQIMEKAKKDNLSIVLITSDQKEDWWLKIKEKTIGPRPELIKEIFQHNVIFHMYTMENFLDYAKPIYKLKKVTVDEIGEVNKKIILEEELGSNNIYNSGIESNTKSLVNDEAGKQTQ